MPVEFATRTFLRIGIAGVWGRMGQTLLGEILRSEGAFLFAAGSESTSHPRFGDPLLDPQTREPLGSSAFGDTKALFEVSDVVLDFTTPEAVPQHAAAAAANSTGMPQLNSGFRGDMIVEAQVETPKNLTKAQKELLRQFGTRKEDSWSPEASGFLKRVVDFLRD